MALGLAHGLGNLEYAEIAIPDEEAGSPALLQDDLAGQDLFAQGEGAQRAGQDRAGVGTEADDGAQEAPIGLGFGLITVGRKRFGDVAIGAQANGGTIEQADEEAAP